MPSTSPTTLSRWATVSSIVSNLVSYIYIDDYAAPSASAQLDYIGGLLREASQILEYSKESLLMYERALPLPDFAAFIAQHRTKAPARSVESINLEVYRNRVVELHTVITVFDEDVCSASRKTVKRNSPQLRPAFPDEEISHLELLGPVNVQASKNSAVTSSRRDSEKLGAASGVNSRTTSAAPSAPSDSDVSWYRRVFSFATPDCRIHIVGDQLDLNDDAPHAISDLRQRWTGRLEVNGFRVLDHGREYLSIEDAIENFEDFGIAGYSTS
ncbi:hypothetical protein FRC10_004501 [Ceratobasidium sp. 414]|nr:hypothetical protein FRC10_004501 [Ceratobasidium sp. 414]